MKKFKTALIQALFTFVMLVILLPVTVHAREINGVNLMLTPPAIGKTLDFDVIVEDESACIIESGFDVTWYKDWGASGYQKCDVYHTVEAGVPYTVEIILTPTEGNYFPDVSRIYATANGSTSGVTLEDDSPSLICRVSFEKLGYTVSFDGAGGTGAMNDMIHYGEFTFPKNRFAAAYFDARFNGWIVGDNTETWYYPGMTITLTEDVTVYANWIDTTKKHTVTFLDYYTLDPETNENPTDIREVSAGTYTLPDTPFPETAGWLEFDYWEIDTNNDRIYEIYYPGDTITVGCDLTAYIHRRELPTASRAVFKATVSGGIDMYKHGMPAGLVSVSIEDAPHITLVEGGYGHGYWIQSSDKLPGSDTLSTSRHYSLYVRFRVDEGCYMALIGHNIELTGDFGKLTTYSDPHDNGDGTYSVFFPLPHVTGRVIRTETVTFVVNGYEAGQKVTDIKVGCDTQYIAVFGSGYGSIYEGSSHVIYKNSYSSGNAIYDGYITFEILTDYYLLINFTQANGYSLPDSFWKDEKLVKEKFLLDGVTGAEPYRIDQNSVGYTIIFKLPQIGAEKLSSVELTLNGYEEGRMTGLATVTIPETLSFYGREDNINGEFYYFIDTDYESDLGGDYASIPHNTVLTRGEEYFFVSRIIPAYGYDVSSLKPENITLNTSNGSCTAIEYEKDRNFDFYWALFALPVMDETPAFAISGTFTTFSDGETAIALYKSASDTTPIAQTTVSGRTGTYTLYVNEGLTPGQYILRISKKNHVTRNHTIRLGS